MRDEKPESTACTVFGPRSTRGPCLATARPNACVCSHEAARAASRTRVARRRTRSARGRGPSRAMRMRAARESHATVSRDSRESQRRRARHCERSARRARLRAVFARESAREPSEIAISHDLALSHVNRALRGASRSRVRASRARLAARARVARGSRGSRCASRARVRARLARRRRVTLARTVRARREDLCENGARRTSSGHTSKRSCPTSRGRVPLAGHGGASDVSSEASAPEPPRRPTPTQMRGARAALAVRLAALAASCEHTQAFGRAWREDAPSARLTQRRRARW